MKSREKPPVAGAPQPLWYQDAVIYELRVRSFYDSDGDGSGDLRGLIEKLGYLQDLGVTALWLLPFYPSPLRDDGYDISDYTGVHPLCGTLADFERFLAEAHRRGLRVITELVLNHSSDQHPWFQRARRAPPGSPEREVYVWRDTPTHFDEARIIFRDYEPSNWSWDPLARAYYWHRFYAHQPDLNYDNPAVCAAMLEVLDFWLGMGVDGLRLDAVPYLFERDGTSCENLPETHAFLRALRAHVDARFTDRMLLAEANQWPEDAVAYFGDGDECHMAFHFPVMPRIFVAIHLEDRFPLADILAQTPPLPPGCQWALFLRNHDELTLEMVAEEERDAMYRAYAAEPVMRLNLGIRRRLAPLTGNDRRHIELMNGLLFSLPGTPVLYYGDEIGMGDNVYLGDRDGVRTPMQWSADKNAGFSRANPQKLVLPVIVDPEYHYESVNVEAQQRSPASLLWWTKRLVALRKRHAAFGRGSLELLRPDNPRILAFVRSLDDEVILVVANLSRYVQPVELDLSPWKGRVPVELFGRSTLPVVGDAPYPLTLAGHGFYWLALTAPPRDEARAAAYEPPLLGGTDPLGAAPSSEQGAALAEVLEGWVRVQPWFAGGRRQIETARLAEVVPVGDPAEAWVVVLELSYEDDGPVERYLVPLARADAARAVEVRARAPQAVIATLPGADGSSGVLCDALGDAPSARALLEAVLDRGRLRGLEGTLVAEATGLLPLRAPPAAEASTTPLPRPAGSASGSAATALVIFGERVLADVARHLEDDRGPGLEIARFLAARGADVRVLPLVGAVEYVAARAEPVALVVLRAFVPDEGDAFAHTSGEARRFFERVLARGSEDPAPQVMRPWDALRLAAAEPPEAVRDAIGAFLDTARLVGRRTAELHLALVGGPDTPAFAPEPFTPHDQRGAYQAMRTLAGRALHELGRSAATLPPEALPLAARLLGRRDEALHRFGALLGQRFGSLRTRGLGGVDLRRLRFTGNDLVFVDLDGERGKPRAARRRKGSPLRDVAALIASLHEAVFATLLDPARVRAEDVAAARPWAHAFWEGSAAALLRAYLETAGEGGLAPRAPAEVRTLLDAYLLECGFVALASALAGRGRSFGGAPEVLPVPSGAPSPAVPLELLQALLEGDTSRGDG